MGHRLTTPPATALLTADEAKAQCRIDDDAEDTYIGSLIARATKHCEEICKRAFITQTWTLTMDGWHDRRYWSCGMIYVPRPPLIAVTSASYVDDNGTTQTLAADQYRVDASSQPGRIEPAYNVTWPTLRSVVASVTIVHTAGYGAASAVPEDIKHAVLMLVAHWHRNREAVLTGTISKEVEFALSSLLGPYMMEVYA